MIRTFMETMKEYLKYNPNAEKILSKCKVSSISFAELMDMYGLSPEKLAVSIKEKLS